MIKIKKFDLNNILDSWLEKNVEWFNDNRLKVFVFVMLTVIWVTAYYLPYLNLVFRKDLVIFLILSTLFLVFKLTWKFIIYFCFGLFFISYLLTSFGFLQNAELLGNYIYGFLIIAVIKLISSI